MSTETENRVVQMEFENNSFERNVNQTLNSLTELDQSLAHLATSAADSLDLVKASDVGDMELSGLARSVDLIADRFTNLGIVGVAALVRITNQAIDTGERLVKSLSVDQLSAGWDKYTQKTASVQAIVNATGKSMSEINGYLDELMWFSDETSYGFTDMTMALGMLTSAGGEVENLIPMIEGVANATALAGKGTAEFGRAMYNLNQSYSMGSLQYMDWKSLELAGVASAQLKEELIRVGEEMGKISKGSVNVGNFSTTLSKRWADKEVMEKAFGNFAQYSRMAFEMVQNGEFDTASEAYEHIAKSYDNVYLKAAKAAQEAKSFAEAIDATKDAVSSGWMKTFEIIFGDYDEAKRLWTDLANTLWDVFASGAEERNEMLKAWKNMGGRTMILNGIADIWHTIVDLTSAFKEGFREIFPKTTANQLKDMSLAFRRWARTVTISDETLENIKTTAKGLASVLDILLMPVKAIIKLFAKMTAVIKPLMDIFFAVTAAISNFVISIRDALKSMDPFNRVLEAVSDSIGKLLDGINSKISSFRTVNTDGISEGVEKIDKSMSPLTFIAEKISGLFDRLIKIIEATGDMFYKMGEFVGGVISQLAVGFVDTINSLNFDRLREVLNTALYSSIVVSLQTFLTSLTGLTTSITETIGGFKGFGGALIETFELIQSSVKSDVILKVAKATLMLAAAFIIFTTIPAEKLASASAALSILAVNLTVMTNSFLPLLNPNMVFTMLSLGVAITGIATAVVILSGAVKILSTIKFEDLIKGLSGMIVSVASLVMATTKLTGLTGTRVAGFRLILLASSIVVLAQAVRMLSSLKWGELAKGLIGVGTILTSVAIFMKKTESLSGISGSVGLIAMASGILILSQAVKSLSSINAGGLAKAITGLVALMTAMGVFSQALSKNYNLMSIGTSMIFLGVAMNAVALAIKQLADIPLAQLGSAVLILGTALAEMTAALAVLSETDVSVKSSVAMGILSASLLLVAKAVNSFASLNWQQALQAMIMLGSSLTMLAIGLRAMEGTLKGSAALLVAAGAITLMAAPLALFSQLGLKGIGVSLLMLAGVIGVFAVSALALSPIIPILYSLAGAFALFGAGTALVGAGLVAIGAGFTSIAAAIAVGAVSMSDFMDMFIQFIPDIISSVGRGLIKIADVLVEGIPIFEKLIIESVTAVLNVLDELLPEIITAVIKTLDTIAKETPKFVEVALKLILGFLEGVSQALPDIITAGVDIAINFINGILANQDRIINTGFDVVISFINGMAKALRERMPELMEAFANFGAGLVRGLIEGAKKTLPRLWNFVKETGENIVTGLVEAIKNKAKELKDTVVGIFKNMWKGVTDFFEIHSPSKLAERTGGQIMEGFILGFEGSESALSDSAKEVLSHFMDEFDKGIPIFENMGENLMSSLSTGIDKRLAELNALETAMQEAEEAERQKQEEIANTQEALKEALKKAAKAAREGDVGFDNQAAIQGYMKKLGRGLADEAEVVEETVYDAIEKEREALNELKAGIEERTAKDANDKWLAELEEALTQEGYDKGLIKPMVTETVSTVAKEVKASAPKISKAMDTVVVAADKTPEMNNVGANMGKGLAAGIMGQRTAIEQAMVTTIDAAISAAKDTAEIASPSKVFRLIGYFIDKGLALGITDNVDLAETSSRYLGESTIKMLQEVLDEQSDLLDGSMDISPVISPVLDLEDVKDTWQRMSFDDAVVNARLRARDISTKDLTREEAPPQQIVNKNTYEFNQTNNSPKELSRLDIYRQTKNQFAMFKQEVLNGVSTSNSY